MELKFEPPRDGKEHIYCLGCLRESGLRESVRFVNGAYHCSKRSHSERRALIIDPKVVWWLDETGEYWHKSAAIFVVSEGKILLFERVKFPPGYTMPAGHVDDGEEPIATAIRELLEETGISSTNLTKIAVDAIRRDQCRRGADVHLQFTYALRLPAGAKITIDPKEGNQPVWLTPQQALALGGKLTPATRYVLERYAGAILAVR